MKTVRLNSWGSFKNQINDLFADSAKRRIDTNRYVSTPIFRGHADSRWKLETTLEREFSEEMKLEYFYSTLLYPTLNMLRGVIDLTQLSEPMRKVSDIPFRDLARLLPSVEQMAWLRHHGAVSPLLDWTYSPYVAAYFAFSPPINSEKGNVAIFAFREYLGQGKGYQESKARIGVHGRWMPVHTRHIRQQSLYTVCVRSARGGPVFSSHERAELDRPFKQIEFDAIIKFEIPAAERQIALEDLTRMNVTEYSLFETQDALIKTVSRFASVSD